MPSRGFSRALRGAGPSEAPPELGPPLVRPRGIVLRLISRPPQDGFIRVMNGLGSQVRSYDVKRPWADRAKRVPFGPAQVVSLGRVAFLSGNRRAGSLHALK